MTCYGRESIKSYLRFVRLGPSRDLGRMSATPETSKTLFLFSSNQRLLYEQDIIDLLACPKGFRYQFRYHEKYLGRDLGPSWQQDKLIGIPVLTIFSIQQQEKYHESALIPVRLGRVVKTSREGSIFVVEFELQNYVSLPPTEKPEERGEQVRTFSKTLKERLADTPDTKKSAAIGPDCSDLFEQEDQPACWETTATYLSRTLSFRESIFVRFSGLTEAGSNGDALSPKDGVFELVAGHSYDLRVAHFRDPPLTDQPKTFQVITDEEIVSVVHPTEFPVTSGYDNVRIAIHALNRTDTRESTLVVSPKGDAKGAKMTLRIRVAPSPSSRVVGVAGTATAVLAAAMPGILGAGTDLHWRVLLGAGGALLAAWLVDAGLKRG